MKGDESKADGRRVGQHVSGVRNQRQAAGEIAADDLGDHIAEDQHQRRGQIAPAGPAKIMRKLVRAMVVATGVVLVTVGGHRHTLHQLGSLSRKSGRSKPGAVLREDLLLGPNPSPAAGHRP